MDHLQLAPKNKRSYSRPWLVITDPSGDFMGRAFRSFDLKISHITHWPQGITFWNQSTGAVKKWNGSAFEVFIPTIKGHDNQKATA